MYESSSLQSDDVFFSIVKSFYSLQKLTATALYYFTNIHYLH